ncbi:MAG: hypothetical protein AABY51_09520 [Deltaproteobacteria bacterium]|mgnify:CR=1 FL=1
MEVIPDGDPFAVEDWTEYKTMRQYQTIGCVLEEMRTYGYGGAIETLISNGLIANEENGHDWINRDQDL